MERCKRIYRILTLLNNQGRSPPLHCDAIRRILFAGSQALHELKQTLRASPVTRGAERMEAGFATATFSPTEWLNDALRAPGSADEPLEMRLSVLLTKLQLSAADVDADVHRRCTELAALTTPVSRELGLVSKQAAAVRTELATLLEEVGSLEERSEASVGTLRDVLAVRERFATAAHTLQQAERAAALLRSAEGSFARGDAATAAAGVAQLGGALDALGPTQLQLLFPDAATKVGTLRGQLLDRLRPELLQAVREHDSAAMLRLSGLFAGLGSAGVVREVYVQCAQGPVFEQWNAAQRATSTRASLEALWSCVEELVPAERTFVTTVFADDAALLPTLLSEALEEIGPQIERTILADLPTAGDGSAGSGTSQLPDLWVQALHRTAALAEELGGPAALGVPRVMDALLLPFEAAQQRFAASLSPSFSAQLPPVPAPPADASRRAVAHAAAAVDRTTTPLGEVLLAAASAASSFGGPLGAAATCDLVCDLAEAHAAALTAALPPLRPSGAGDTTQPVSAEAHLSAAGAQLAAGEEGSIEGSRDALSLLRAMHALRERIERIDGAVADVLRKSAVASQAAPLQTAAQRTAAAELSARLQTSAGATILLPRASAAVVQLLHRTQQLAFDALTAPVAAAMRQVSSPEVAEVWRGRADAEEELAMAAFSATPQMYITEVGNHLLGLPQQLEPFATGPTLSHLSAALRRGESGADDGDGGAFDWLTALGARTVDLVLAAADRVSALSPRGAKQLAADAAYVDNILSGLGAASDARLAELGSLLTASTAQVPAAVAASSALPAGLLTAIAAKRGVALG